MSYSQAMPQKKNPIAVALGRLAAGKPKRFTEEEKKRRGERLRQFHSSLSPEERERRREASKASRSPGKSP